MTIIASEELHNCGNRYFLLLSSKIVICLYLIIRLLDTSHTRLSRNYKNRIATYLYSLCKDHITKNTDYMPNWRSLQFNWNIFTWHKHSQRWEVWISDKSIFTGHVSCNSYWATQGQFKWMTLLRHISRNSHLFIPYNDEWH